MPFHIAALLSPAARIDLSSCPTPCLFIDSGHKRLGSAVVLGEPYVLPGLALGPS